MASPWTRWSVDERRNPSAEVSIVTEEPTHDEPVEDEEDVSPIAGIGTLVFGKWDASEVVCSDPGLAPYINLRTVGVPHTGGRHANAWFGKSKLSVVERYINKLMRTGKYTGKKQGATKAFEAALDRIHDRTSSNPLQVFVDAIVHAARWRRSRAFDSAQSASPRPWMPHRADASTPPCATSRRVLNKGRPNPSDPWNNASSMRSSKPQMVM